MIGRKDDTTPRADAAKDRAARDGAEHGRMGHFPVRSVMFSAPDTGQPGFARACEASMAAVRDSDDERAVLAWLDDVADTEGWR